MKTKNLLTAITVAAGLISFGTTHAIAQDFNYYPPASGLQILDLGGTPIIGGITNYTASFEATSEESTVTFVFRHDPGYFTLNNASVADILSPSINLFTNGDFSAGATSPGGGAPGWTYFQQNGVTYLGQELARGGWYDGSTGGYDGINQSFATIIGDTYQVSFDLSQTGANADFYQQVSNNGRSGTAGNGIDVLVYAGNGIPTNAVPEPSTYALFALGALVFFVAYKKMKRRAC